jgi:K+-transporting ATPase ATPase C chain
MRIHLVALRAMILATVVLGVGYTLLITGVGQLALPAQANGSLLERDGEAVGSSLVGQTFEGAAEYFQSRPSAAGDGYDAGASSGSNLGPENPDLLAAIEERRAAVAEFEGIDVADVPVDALTASASGLDPHISPEYARLQADRVAEARGLDTAAVRELVDRTMQGPDLAEARVNVLELNLALDDMEG